MMRKKSIIATIVFLFTILFFMGYRSNQDLTASLLKRQPEILGGEGFGNSLRVDNKKSILASYLGDSGKLILAKKEGGEWKKETVSEDAFDGSETSLALNNQGDISILYIGENEILKLAVKNNKKWDLESIFKGAALYCNLVFDKDNNSHITFWSPKKGIVYGKKENDKWNIEVLDYGGVGWWNGLAVDENNLPHISYFDFENKNLLYLHFNGKHWKKEIVDFGRDVGRWNSIVIGKDNRPIISYFDFEKGDLKVAEKDEGGWTIEVVDSKDVVGEQTNIVLDNYQNPVISYVGSSDNSFRIARKIDNDWEVFVIERKPEITERNIRGDLGGNNSIFIDKDGNLYLLWQDLFHKKLRYLEGRL